MTLESRIYGPFTGWHGDALFKLANGQYWLQAEYKYRYLYKYRPKVIITQTGHGHVMAVDGMEGCVRVRRTNAVESRIDGAFEGWSGETTFELQNGQAWQQSAYAYWYHYAYCPEVVMYETPSGYMFRVADNDNSVSVRRIR